MSASIDRPGFFRRIAAMVYDSFLVFPIALFCVAMMVGLRLLIDGAAPAEGQIAISGVWRLPTFLAFLAGIFAFYGYFWTKLGQTLAMQAWRMKLIDGNTGELVDWKKAALRFLCVFVSIASCGLGYLWIFIDKERKALHDHLSGTELIMVEKR